MDKQLRAQTSDSLLRKWHAYLSLPSISVFLLTAVISYFFIDKPVAVFFHDHQNFYALKFVDLFAIGYIYVLLFILAGLCCKYRANSQRGAFRMFFFAGWFALIYTLCGVFKVLLGRARPTLWFSDRIYGFHGLHLNHDYQSFPSGHTTTFITITLILGFLFPKYWKIFIMIGVLASLTRVVFFDHYLSDVVLTATLVFISLVQALTWLRRTDFGSKII